MGNDPFDEEPADELLRDLARDHGSRRVTLAELVDLLAVDVPEGSTEEDERKKLTARLRMSRGPTTGRPKTSEPPPSSMPGGRAFGYHALTTREEHAAAVMTGTLTAARDKPKVLTSFVAQLDARQRKQLRRMLEK